MSDRSKRKSRKSRNIMGDQNVSCISLRAGHHDDTPSTLAEKLNKIYADIAQQIYDTDMSQCRLLIAVLVTEITKTYTNAELVTGLTVAFNSYASWHCWSRNDVVGTVDVVGIVSKWICVGRNIELPRLELVYEHEGTHYDRIDLTTQKEKDVHENNKHLVNIYRAQGLKCMWKTMFSGGFDPNVRLFFRHLYDSYGIAYE